MTRVAAVIVTCNSERWIEATLASVLGQSRAPDAVIVVDDGSTDATRRIVGGALGGLGRVVDSTASSDDRFTRIAHNFRQGLLEVGDCDVAVLGDHDDLWHPERVEGQCALLDRNPSISLLASDGRLVDDEGRPIGGTLRDTFRVPADFNDQSAEDRMRIVLRKSVATGGASAVRPARYVDVAIPEGWLHDRWWSLVAAAREELFIDDEIAVDYRVSAGQQVGLDTGHQGQALLGRMMAAVRGLRTTMNKLDDIRLQLPQFATEATLPSLTGPRLLRNLM